MACSRADFTFKCFPSQSMMGRGGIVSFFLNIETRAREGLKYSTAHGCIQLLQK
jgi:hypothetical protein